MIDQNSIIAAIQKAMQASGQQGQQPQQAAMPAAPMAQPAQAQKPSLITGIMSAMQGNPTGGLLGKMMSPQGAMGAAPQVAQAAPNMMNPGLLSGMGLY